MRNHDQKIKDMAESVLPSKRRQSAKQHRRAIHKRSRRHVNDELHSIRRGNEGERTETCVGLTVDVNRELSYMVERRRKHDRVSPVMRWAGRRVDADPLLREATPAEQLEYFRRIMPDNLIGRHAVDHIEDALVWRAMTWRDEVATKDSADRRGGEYRDLVQALVEAGLHGRLNAVIKEQRRRERNRYAGDRFSGRSEQYARRHLLTGARLLLGAHDVESFAGDTRSSLTVPKLVKQVLQDRPRRRGHRQARAAIGTPGMR